MLKLIVETPLFFVILASIYVLISIRSKKLFPCRIYFCLIGIICCEDDLEYDVESYSLYDDRNASDSERVLMYLL